MSIYSDFDFSFSKDIYGNLKKQIDLQSIKQSIKQILLTPIGSIRYNLEFGSNVHKALFEKINPVLEILLKQEIIFALENWEPRISVKDVIDRKSTRLNSSH